MHLKLIEKLKQDRGASLTFALLLFMVCAVIGSVVLASATATAGRASETVAMDQRYYSVSSAAELFRETLNGKSVTYTLTRTATRTETTTITPVLDGSGNPTGADTVTTVYDPDPPSSLTFGAGDYSGHYATDFSSGNPMLLKSAAEAFLGAWTDEEIFTATGFTLAADAVPSLPDLELTVTGPSHPEGLKVDVEQTLRPDGGISLLFSNPTGDQYKLRLALSVDKNIQTTRSEVPTGTPSVVTNPTTGVTTRTDTYTVIETRTIVITWNATGIGKAA